MKLAPAARGSGSGPASNLVIRAVLWDNDGVLVDTEALYFQASRETLEGVGVTLNHQEFAEISLGQGRSLFELARDRGFSEDDLSRLREARDDRYTEILRDGVRVIPGVEPCLETLGRQYRQAIVTSCKKNHFDEIHRHTALLRFFEFALTPDDYGAHKPDPEPYLTAAQRMGLSPSECVVVEDSERGVRSAVAAEMYCLAIPNALSRRGDLSAAHRVLSSVTEVAGVVAALSAK